MIVATILWAVGVSLAARGAWRHREPQDIEMGTYLVMAFGPLALTVLA